MKTFITYASLIGLGLFISGCSVFYDQDDNGNVQSQACRAMKRQMTYNARSNSADARYATASQRDALQQRYEEYGCDNQ